MEDKKEKLSPSAYFDLIKGAKNTITTDALKNSYGVFVSLAEKYNRLGQKESLKKLSFLADTLIKEEKLIEMGITTYVYRDTIEDYIENVSDKTVKIVELSRYMREVPDELVDIIEKARGIFDELYVVFTDYTGKEERKVAQERREKDPILFGVFKTQTNVADRFYFLGDWVDEYCDLTLDKMVEQYVAKKGASPVLNSSIPQTSEELLELMKSYVRKDGEEISQVTLNNSTLLPVGAYKRDNTKTKKSFFEKVRSVFKKK